MHHSTSLQESPVTVHRDDRSGGACDPDEYFSLESRIIEYFAASVIRTKDPEEANMFLIAHDIECTSYSKFITNRDQNKLYTLDDFEAEFIDPVWNQFTKSKYFLRSGGSDHIFPYFADNGAFCDEGPQERLPGPLRPKYSKYLENVSIISYYGMLEYAPYVVLDKDYSYNGCFRPHQDIVVPQWHTFSKNCYQEEPALGLQSRTRKALTFFYGAIRSDIQCSPGCRVAMEFIAPLHKANNSFSFNDGAPQLSSLDSFISFAPAGAACWSTRLFDAICSSSIPVIIAKNVV
jgi:Exostosin family